MITFSQKLGHEFRDQQLLEQALTHRSFHNENAAQSKGHNERLEFLGDAVLDLCLSDILFRDFPQLDEGAMSKIRASLVNEAILAEVAKEQNFDQYLRLGKGEMHSGGANKPRLLASVFEAYVGALYLDAGFEKSLEFLKYTFASRIGEINNQETFVRDYKTRLQEKAQELHRQAPSYEVVSENGPDHDKVFVVAVKVGTSELAQGQGRSKKQAEQEAARAALEEWK